jgi:hypothetical protein
MAIYGKSGARFQDKAMTDVPSDVMESPKLNARAKRESLRKKKKGKFPGLKMSYRDAGDALAAARF